MSHPTVHPLKRYREANHLSHRDFARRALTNQTTVQRIESGVISQPTYQTIHAIVHATRGAVTVLDIFRWHYRHVLGEWPEDTAAPARLATSDGPHPAGAIAGE